MFIAFGISFVGYWLAWYGYATLRQPTTKDAGGKGVGITDLLLPSQVAKVDQAIAAGWYAPAKSNSTGGNAPPYNPNTPGGSGTPGAGGIIPGVPNQPGAKGPIIA